jgi:hypothetical protein
MGERVVIAQVAQSAEHVLGKDEVGGSIPLLGLNLCWPLGQKLYLTLTNSEEQSDGEGAV